MQHLPGDGGQLLHPQVPNNFAKKKIKQLIAHTFGMRLLENQRAHDASKGEATCVPHPQQHSRERTGEVLTASRPSRAPVAVRFEKRNRGIAPEAEEITQAAKKER